MDSAGGSGAGAGVGRISDVAGLVGVTSVAEGPDGSVEFYTTQATMKSKRTGVE